MSEGEKFNVGIAGAGAIAFGNAVFLEQLGHRAMIWSPSGRRTTELAAGAPLMATGAVEGSFHPAVAAGARELAEQNTVILLALPANGHKMVMDALAPHIRADHTILISSHASLGALYFSKILFARKIVVPIVAWGTTITTGRQPNITSATVNTIRSKVDFCTVPDNYSKKGADICRLLFGDRFVQRDSLLAISLSNLNPQNHMGIALANMARMEHGETWGQGYNITPNVGRLLEALDLERLAIAESLGVQVRTIFEHFHLSFHVPVASISAMNQDMHQRGTGGTGPATADSRYVTEDVPYGLLLTTKLGQLAQRPAILHQAGIEIFSAMYGRDFFSENELLDAIGLESLSLADLRKLSKKGFTTDN